MQKGINASPAGTYVLQSQQEQINAPRQMQKFVEYVESQFSDLRVNKTFLLRQQDWTRGHINNKKLPFEMKCSPYQK